MIYSNLIFEVIFHLRSSSFGAFLAAIATLYVTMSVSQMVGGLVGRSDGLSVCLQRVSTIVQKFKIEQNA